jgi:probable F420-dependent oxidoreductase
MSDRPRILVSMPVGTRMGGDDPRAQVELAKRVEGAGADGVVLADHVLMGKHPERYPWGTFPFPADAPWLEPLTVLTAIAAVTERITLTTGILIVPLRPAALLAKIVATLDVLSCGRLELGVGTGWQEEEFTAQGLDPAQRGQLLTDAVAACRELWRGGPASFASETVTFEDVWSEPTPVREGGPAILFSGTLTRRNLDRIVRLGDGWIPIMGETPDGISSGVATLRDELSRTGRDPSSLIVRAPAPIQKGADGAPSLGATLDGVDTLAELGVTDVNLHIMAFAPTDDAVPAYFDELERRLASW